MTIQGEGVTSKGVQQHGIVAIGCILVCDELAVLPDANHVGEDEDGGVLVDLFAAGFNDVCVIAIDFDT